MSYLTPEQDDEFHGRCFTCFDHVKRIHYQEPDVLVWCLTCGLLCVEDEDYNLVVSLQEVNQIKMMDEN